MGFEKNATLFGRKIKVFLIKKYIQKCISLVLLMKKCVKGIVSRDFEGLQMILINRLCVPDVPLEVYSFLNFRFHIVI